MDRMRAKMLDALRRWVDDDGILRAAPVEVVAEVLHVVAVQEAARASRPSSAPAGDGALRERVEALAKDWESCNEGRVPTVEENERRKCARDLRRALSAAPGTVDKEDGRRDR